MQLANLESREVLLAKLAGAMKGSLAKAARVFDALRIKLEAEQGAPATAAPAAEVQAPAATAATEEAVVVTEETPTEDVAEAPVAEATVETTEATPETEEKE
jgi:large subunit ribosomal protein L10